MRTAIRLIYLSVAFTILSLSSAVQAVPITYQYTSGALSPSGSSGIPGVTTMSLMFTVDLAVGLSGSDQKSALSAWSITDGVTTWTNASSEVFLDLFSVDTDAAAIITAMNFFIAPDGVRVPVGGNFTMQMGLSTARTSYCIALDSSGINCVGANTASASGVSGGVVGVVDVPVPATLALLGLGLAGLGISRRKRTTQS